MPNVNDTITLSEDVSILRVNDGVQVYLNNELITKSVITNTLVRDNIITRQVDRAKFTIRNYGNNHTHVPVVGHSIEIYNDGTKIFGGVVIKFTQRAEDYKIILFDIECEDFTRLLDRRLVVNTYKNQTIQQIIEDINNNFLTDFTINNVNGGDKVIAYIAFNYIPASQCFQRLADLINYDWFVDYDKDIHFFSKGFSTAPFSIIDTDGSYIFKSLRIRRDNSQLKNKVFVRGGEFLANTLTTEFISDGIQNTYTLPYRYDEMKTTVTGEQWEQGIDNIDIPSTKDYIWNDEEKFIRFRTDRIPSDTSSIKIIGQPFLPVRAVVQDEESIAQMISVEGGTGEYEFLIIDNSIASREGARERASAELESYKQTLSEGSFRTYNDGLEAGMTITINSDAHGINEDFMINKVTARMWTNDRLQYDISLVTTKTFGIIEFLQNLLVKSTEEIIINPNEVLDLVHAKSENISIGETVVTSKTHNPQSETLTFEEVVTEQSLNFLIEFVLGPFSPTNTKRVFILDGSFLGPDHVTNPVDSISISDVVTNITII